MRRWLMGAGLLALGLPLVWVARSEAEQGGSETIKVVSSHDLPNVPGKSVTAILVSYAPGGKSAKHHHAGSVLAFVVSGENPLRELGDGASEGLQGRRELLRAAGERASRERKCERERASGACSRSSSPMTGRSSPPSTSRE